MATWSPAPMARSMFSRIVRPAARTLIPCMRIETPAGGGAEAWVEAAAGLRVGAVSGAPSGSSSRRETLRWRGYCWASRASR